MAAGGGMSMAKIPGLSLSEGMLRGLFYISRYRFLTIHQFAKIANYSNYHAGEMLRRLESNQAVGFFGFTSIPGQGKTPKVYYLRRRGWEYLATESDYTIEEIGPFIEVSQELTWTPQMYHRLRLLDLFIALECEVLARPYLKLVTVLLEYRRLPKSYLRETGDYVSDDFTPENRIVPDGAFILENQESGRRGLFLVEMDMGTERVKAVGSADKRATIIAKFEQYDRYLTSGRFAATYKAYGEFRSLTVLFVTIGPERVENIRKEARRLNARLHQYYRLTTFSVAITDFLGSIWKSRDGSDTVPYPLIQIREGPGRP
jgi:hypothetical protein